MKPAAYYNEFDPEKAAWLRELISVGVIAAGDVDERSIHDVRPADLRGYLQCHFFAGIGIWSYALRLAGWPDDCEVWTGSCPCPSFSAAGKGQGFDDPRHLWPAWFGLTRERLPPVVFGEQVDDAIGHGWLDLVQTDMEGKAYAVGKAVLGAASVGAPHIRQRLYFCADTERAKQPRDNAEAGRPLRYSDAGSGPDADGWQPSNGDVQRGRQQRLLAEDCGASDGGDSEAARLQTRIGDGDLFRTDGRARAGFEQTGATRVDHDSIGIGRAAVGNDDIAHVRFIANATGATRGFWRDCDWWYGKDGKYRPIERGLLPLAHGTPARVLRLRGYGDGIVAQAAAAFVRAYMEAR